MWTAPGKSSDMITRTCTAQGTELLPVCLVKRREANPPASNNNSKAGKVAVLIGVGGQSLCRSCLNSTHDRGVVTLGGEGYALAGGGWARGCSHAAQGKTV